MKEIDEEQVSQAVKCNEEKTLQAELAYYKSEASRFCLTTDCVLTTSDVLRRMDLTVHPCEDFWQYTCGGWLADHQNEPVYGDSWGVEDEVEANIRRHISHWLEESRAQCDDYNATTTTDCKMRLLYSRCMDMETINAVDAKPLQDILDDFGGWSALGLNFIYLSPYTSLHAIDLSSYYHCIISEGDIQKSINQNVLTRTLVSLIDRPNILFISSRL